MSRPEYNALWAIYPGPPLYIDDVKVSKDGMTPTGLFMSTYKGSSALRRGSVPNMTSIEGTPQWDSLRPWQKECYLACLRNKKRRGVIEAATGTGKTRVQVALLSSFDSGIITVPTIDLLMQTKVVMEQLLGEEVGVMGNNLYTTHRYNVAIPKTLLNKGAPKADIWISDECHTLMNMEGWRTHLLFPDTFYRFAFSATPKGNDLETAIFGEKFFRYVPKEAIRDGNIHKPKVSFHKVKTPPLGKLTGSVNRYHTLSFLRKQQVYSQVFNQCILDNEERNRLVAQLSLDAEREGRKTLIIGERISPPELSQLKRINVWRERLGGKAWPEYHSDVKAKEKRQILEDIKGDILDGFLAGPNSITQGTDIPKLDCLIIATAKTSVKDLIQRIGRALRIGSKEPLVHLIIDDHPFFSVYNERKVNVVKETYG